MEKDKKLISLKEAAELSGYSSDYIGQLIRGGKIFGEQVFSNVTWMTTEEEVLAYKNKSKKKNLNESGFWLSKKRQLMIQFRIIKIIFENSKFALILLSFFIFLFFISISFVYYIFFSVNNYSQLNIENNTNAQSQY